MGTARVNSNDPVWVNTQVAFLHDDRDLIRLERALTVERELQALRAASSSVRRAKSWCGQ